jgi:endonuclease/exonuclease/phosphatase family metal-dependent hydrolase
MGMQFQTSTVARLVMPQRLRQILGQMKQPPQSNAQAIPRGGKTISVASYNIHKCVGADGKFNPGRVMDVLGELNADIVALQEADMRFGDRKGVLDLKFLHDKLGYLTLPKIGSKSASHGWHGNVVLYREGVAGDAHRLKLPGLEPRGAVVVDLDLAKGSLRVIAAHLGLLRSSRERQMQMILKAAQPADGRPVIVLGDTNEWRIGRRSALRLLDPHFGPVDRGVASFPAAFPVFALDRVLASPNIVVHELEAHLTPLAQIASDHLPVKAVIEIKTTSQMADQVRLAS